MAFFLCLAGASTCKAEWLGCCIISRLCRACCTSSLTGSSHLELYPGSIIDQASLAHTMIFSDSNIVCAGRGHRRGHSAVRGELQHNGKPAAAWRVPVWGDIGCLWADRRVQLLLGVGVWPTCWLEGGQSGLMIVLAHSTWFVKPPVSFTFKQHLWYFFLLCFKL